MRAVIGDSAESDMPDDTGWTVLTVKEHFTAIQEEQAKAVAAALAAAEKAVAAALASQQLAVQVAQENTKEWQKNSNEWRQTVNDLINGYMPRREVEAMVSAMRTEFTQRFETQAKILDEMQKRQNTEQGHKEGVSATHVGIAAVIGMIVGMAAIYAFLSSHLKP